MGTERRRSERYALLQEEIAVVHHLHLDRPATLIDFSAKGALLRLVEIPGVPEFHLRLDDRLNISLQSGQIHFSVDARIVREGPGFIAVEFVETRPETLTEIDGKARRLGALHTNIQARMAEA